MESSVQKRSGVQKRICLGGCNKLFLSAGPENRVCPECAKRNNKIRDDKTVGRNNGHAGTKKLSV